MLTFFTEFMMWGSHRFVSVRVNASSECSIREDEFNE